MLGVRHYVRAGGFRVLRVAHFHQTSGRHGELGGRSADGWTLSQASSERDRRRLQPEMEEALPGVLIKRCRGSETAY